MDDDVSVLIVDDSALMRGVIARIVEATPGLALAEKAMNGLFALQKIPRVDPDVIVLDLEMPGMNGIEFLEERQRRGIEVPVVILSSLARRGADLTMRALSLGASDFILKPAGAISEDIHDVRDALVGMLLGYGGAYRRARGKRAAAPPAAPVTAAPERGAAAGPPVRARQPGRPEVVAIGVSTGGPDALRAVLAGLDRDIGVPVLVVQHMPAGFTAEFARSLDRISPLEVKEAEDGDELVPGRVLIAQGNRHLEVERRGSAAAARLSDAPLVCGHRPSADVLFASVALAYRNHALGIIMTGMGRDGAQQLGTIYREGGITLGQDEASCVVYGMPRVAFELGHVMEQVPLDRMARRIRGLVRPGRPETDRPRAGPPEAGPPAGAPQ